MRPYHVIAILQAPSGKVEGVQIDPTGTLIKILNTKRGTIWLRAYEPREMLVRTPDVEVRRWRRGAETRLTPTKAEATPTSGERSSR